MRFEALQKLLELQQMIYSAKKKKKKTRESFFKHFFQLFVSVCIAL